MPRGSLSLAHVDGPTCDARHSSFHPGKNSVWLTFHLLWISHIRNSVRPTFYLLQIFHIRRLTPDRRGGSLEATLGKASDLRPWRYTSLPLASFWEVINFVDYSLNQRAPAGHESAETPIRNESNGTAAGEGANFIGPRSIRTWTDLQAEFLKKFFPTHRTNGLKRQISNFSTKENEKFYECWERYMEAINACPHHGFDTWLLVSYFYDGMSSSMKQLLETMCGGDFMSKNPKEAMDFLSYVAEVSRGWDELHRGEAGMYTLNEDVDMKAKFTAITRRVEELELKKMHEVQAVAETPVQPNSNASYGNTYNSSWRNHPNFSWKPRAPQYQQPAQPSQPSQQASSLEQAIVNLTKVVGDFVGDQKSINSQLSQRIDSVENTLNKRMDGMQNDLSQKIDNLQYSISRLTNLNTVPEKGRFPSQPHQNPKGIHEVETHEGESSQVRDVKALITLRSGRKVESPTPKPYVEEKEEEETKKREEMKGNKKDISEGKEDRDSTVNANPEKELIKEELMTKRTSPPFPQALHGKKGIKNASEILEVLRQVKVNIPLLDMIKQVSTYAKLLKELCTTKRGLNVNKTTDSTHGSLALKAYQQNLYLEYYY
uniref:Retrotransposon gag domain-containing protein n=1 Tax=Vitis vinifera TaxID=29760 RepID=A5BAD1_VITVI|nr:hypothetical protein VITISV_025827 [Vitis vinifera]